MGRLRARPIARKNGGLKPSSFLGTKGKGGLKVSGIKSAKKPKKKKEKTLTDLKKLADKYFSLYIRNKYADSEGNIQCYTCPTVKPLKKMQNGHFVGRKYLATRYDERNCRPQCWYCNAKHMGNGRPVEFAQGLKKEYGPTIVDELYEKAAPIVPNFNFQEIINIYKEKLSTPPIVHT